ncbi:hypothetical protein LTR70_010105 [Exophiala xenobiotica]|uniref:Nephrocystin 3-like N-terminal domain-containing protein n=1 Tax=Lithohypha guttulata TaxID=1690604 RepID=A0ABR0JUC3_9EURO|nr:hypothetical protein LTR24_010311 [Lithohypha guttulata]KAK5309655.1 hypothetical protein LTR70_010105 [Exophiala xenobiotica]
MASSSDASTGFDNQRSQVQNVATYSGNFQSHGQTWMGNTLNAAGVVQIHHDVRTEAPQAQQERAQMSSNVYISGQARVHLGDNYAANRHPLRSVLKKKSVQLSSNDVDPKSSSWVEDTGFSEWLSRGSTPFWINGKPGSGKSTLMKYLGESKSTLERLPCEGRGWAVVHFFFDYRAGKSTANDILGMLSSFSDN